MKWEKKGFIYNTAGDHDWNRTFACGPTVLVVSDKIWRIYFDCRDDYNHSRPTYIEVEAGNPQNILYVHDRPLLDLGKIGTFDDCGITISSLLRVGEEIYMYYLGWTVRNTISYHNSTGLAISKDGGKTFTKFSEGPLLSPSYKHPYCNGAVDVMKDGDIYRMWYTHFVEWRVYNKHPEPLYNIAYAESKNGIDWDRPDIISVDFKDSTKGGIARPCVIKENSIYRMWYTYRGAADYRTNKANSYRIGYAESADGKIFKRMDDQFTLTVSDEGWDSVMMTYPYVIKHKDQYWMFYNGNGFGESGFGYAVGKE